MSLMQPHVSCNLRNYLQTRTYHVYMQIKDQEASVVLGQLSTVQAKMSL